MNTIEHMAFIHNYFKQLANRKNPPEKSQRKQKEKGYKKVSNTSSYGCSKQFIYRLYRHGQV